MNTLHALPLSVILASLSLGLIIEITLLLSRLRGC